MAYFIRKTEDGRDVYGTDFDIEVKECKQTADGKRIVSMIGSTPSVDRDGDTIRQQGWDLKAYKRNSVVLWGHDQDIPAIARANKVKKSPDALSFDEIEFPKEGIHPFADMIYSLMEAKFIKAGSVGFIPTEMERRTLGEDEPDIYCCPAEFKKQELLEFSIVNVGSNRDALVTHLGAKGFKTTGKVKIGNQEFEMKQLIDALFAEGSQEKGVIPYKKTPKDPEEAIWDGPKEVAAAEVSDLKIMSTWVDSEEPDLKGSYKLPHHRATGKHNVVLRGVNNSRARLSQTNIPESDKKRVDQHLMKHLRDDFDREDVNPVADFTEAELREMAPEVFEVKDITEVPEGAETITKEVVEKVFATEHACRLLSPDDFDSFARKNGAVGSDGKRIDYIYGIKVDKSTLISMRYPKEVWTAVDAQEHCKDKAGTFFEAASGKTVDIPVKLSKQAEEVLKTAIDKAKSEFLAELEKAGAVLSRANKNKLKGAAQAITEVLASAEPAEEDGGHSTDDKTKLPEEEVSLKQILDKLVGLEATVGKLSEQVQAKETPADNEIDLDALKAPKDEINLKDMELPEKKDEVDKETLTKLIIGVQQKVKETVREAIRYELKKVTGIVD